MTQAPLFADLVPTEADKLAASRARVRRETREIQRERFERFGLVVDLDDDAAIAEARRTIEVLLAERKQLVTQGWTWLRGRQERIEDLRAPLPVASVVGDDADAEPRNELGETREETLARMREVDDVF